MMSINAESGRQDRREEGEEDVRENTGRCCRTTGHSPNRKDIENNQDYLDDLKAQKIAFPQVRPPIEVRYEFDDELSRLFYDTITYLTRLDDQEREADGIEYYRYRAIEFLANEKDKKDYGDVKSIADRLAAIMKTFMVKRLESSFFTFRQSLKRFKKATDNMITWFDDDRIPIAPDSMPTISSKNIRWKSWKPE